MPLPLLFTSSTFAALLLLIAAAPASAQAPRTPDPGYQAKAEQYAKVRKGFEEDLAAYWKSIADKRRGRNAKRRSHEPIELDDYVLTHPPVYAGPPQPIDPSAPDKPPPNEPKRPEIPVVADFLKAAFEQYSFVPERPSELEFKQLYAKAAAAVGLTRDQIVRIYAFETGGNGTYDLQAGFEYKRPNARAISPAIGYNQLLSTNSVELMAEQGDRFAAALKRKADELTGAPKAAMNDKLDVLKRMVAFSRTVPDSWNEHDNLAKNTPRGMAIHAAVLDRDIGPLLQVQKLLNSIQFARLKGYKMPLTAAELELMNFTGDGNGLDMVLMPQALRPQVPTSNFFQQTGYERNPVARRNAYVAALIAAIDAQMDSGSRLAGAKDLAAAY
jgi:hypothetical protein